jgi:CRP-like cAMP-binding protein
MTSFIERVEGVVARSPHFRELSMPARTTLAHGTCEKGLADRERFDGTFAIVVDGALQISVASRERATTIAVLGAGSFFSVSALVGTAPPAPLCRSIGRTTLAVVTSARLRAMLHGEGVLRAHVGRLIGMRLDATVALFADATHASLPRRLARRLMAQLLASGTPASPPIELPVTQSMLGELVGASRSSLHEELSLLEHAGVLRRAYRRIVVLDPERLRHAAGRNVAPL